MNNFQQKHVNYQHDQTALSAQNFFRDFLIQFSKNKQHIYMNQLKELQDNNRKILIVDSEDLMNHDNHLYSYILQNYFYLQSILSNAISEVLQAHFNQEIEINDFYTVGFNNLPMMRLRDLKTAQIGKLIQIEGTVTRTGMVQPELFKGAFQCLNCMSFVYNVEQQYKFTEPRHCSNVQCDNKVKWKLVPKESVFCDFQKVKVQENASEMNTGSMPRNIDIVLRNELVELVQPGEKVKFNGTLIVVPDNSNFYKIGQKSQFMKNGDVQRARNNFSRDGIVSLKQIGQFDLQYKNVFVCTSVQKRQMEENAFDQDLEVYQAQQVKKMISQTSNLYQKLSMSICPQIYGHDEIKRALLLQMVGGVQKKTKNGISLRGDINICIVGDPSVGKSQFLKYVSGFIPRSVYTSGKASTAAGLTASVVRDFETKEMQIEAGALMLADNGICCIDEFDKMDPQDIVAIHEAMEQQTISISKAGIHATLNARSSILAAANPIFGRYDKTKNLKFNLNMGAPLMSRFDLFFIILDESDEQINRQVAQTILNQHMGIQTEEQKQCFTMQELQMFVKYVKKHNNPVLSTEAAQLIQQKYGQIRQNDSNNQGNYRITVRQLESLIRLSEALAKIHMTEQVKIEHVQEAVRLLQNSIIKIERPNVECLDIEDEDHQMEVNREQIDKHLQDQRLREEQQQKKVVLTYDEFENIAYFIINYIKNKRSECTQNEIGESYIEQLLACNVIQNKQDSVKMLKIVHSVIQRLISKENILVVVQGDESNYKERVIQINAGYVDSL